MHQATTTTRGHILSSSQVTGISSGGCRSSTAVSRCTARVRRCSCRSGLGLEPWNVLHQGSPSARGCRSAWCSIIVGAAVLLLWIPLRQRPGPRHGLQRLRGRRRAWTRRWPWYRTRAPWRSASRCWSAGIVLNGVATGLYIAARFGPGPRDGLMTGLHQRTGRLDPPGAHGHRGRGRGDRLRPRRHGRHRHGPVRAVHRPARPAVPARVRRPLGIGRQHGRCRGVNRSGRYCAGDHADTPSLPRPSRPDRLRPPGRGGGRPGEHRGPVPARGRGGLSVHRDRCARHRRRQARRLPRRDAGPGDRRGGPDRGPALGRRTARARGAVPNRCPSSRSCWRRSPTSAGTST